MSTAARADLAIHSTRRFPPKPHSGAEKPSTLVAEKKEELLSPTSESDSSGNDKVDVQHAKGQVAKSRKQQQRNATAGRPGNPVDKTPGQQFVAPVNNLLPDASNGAVLRCEARPDGQNNMIKE